MRGDGRVIGSPVPARCSGLPCRVIVPCSLLTSPKWLGRFLRIRCSSSTAFLREPSSWRVGVANRARLVVFEPSGIRDEKLFLECLRASHVLNTRHDRLSGIGGLVKRSQIPVEIETLGAGGLRYRMRRSGRLGEWQHLPAFAAPSVRDTAGSGDWCTAGFLAQLAASRVDIVARAEDARVVYDGLRFGQALAALNCCYDGARGLMYVMGRSGALRAAERLLEHSVPKLPSRSSPPAAAPRSDAAGCVVCASDLIRCTREERSVPVWQPTSEGIRLTEPGSLGTGMRQGVRHGPEARAPRGSPGARLGR